MTEKGLCHSRLEEKNFPFDNFLDPIRHTDKNYISKKPYFPLAIESNDYKCKGCDNIIVADPRDLPHHCSECGAEYSYMLVPASNESTEDIINIDGDLYAGEN